MKKTLFIFVISFVLLFGFHGIVKAQEGPTGQSPATINQGTSSSNDPTSGCKSTEINTAIGCLDVLNKDGPEVFLGQILKWAVGVGGGVAFLLIVYASFMIMTSSGNPERLKAGQELLSSAIFGLILLISSVFVLKFVGIDILGLDKFGFNQ